MGNEMLKNNQKNRRRMLDYINNIFPELFYLEKEQKEVEKHLLRLNKGVNEASVSNKEEMMEIYANMAKEIEKKRGALNDKIVAMRNVFNEIIKKTQDKKDPLPMAMTIRASGIIRTTDPEIKKEKVFEFFATLEEMLFNIRKTFAAKIPFKNMLKDEYENYENEIDKIRKIDQLRGKIVKIENSILESNDVLLEHNIEFKNLKNDIQEVLNFNYEDSLFKLEFEKRTKGLLTNNLSALANLQNDFDVIAHLKSKKQEEVINLIEAEIKLLNQIRGEQDKNTRIDKLKEDLGKIKTSIIEINDVRKEHNEDYKRLKNDLGEVLNNHYKDSRHKEEIEKNIKVLSEKDLEGVNSIQTSVNELFWARNIVTGSINAENTQGFHGEQVKQSAQRTQNEQFKEKHTGLLNKIASLEKEIEFKKGDIYNTEMCYISASEQNMEEAMNVHESNLKRMQEDLKKLENKLEEYNNLYNLCRSSKKPLYEIAMYNNQDKDNQEVLASNNRLLFNLNGLKVVDSEKIVGHKAIKELFYDIKDKDGNIKETVGCGTISYYINKASANKNIVADLYFPEQGTIRVKNNIYSIPKGATIKLKDLNGKIDLEIKNGNNLLRKIKVRDGNVSEKRNGKLSIVPQNSSFVIPLSNKNIQSDKYARGNQTGGNQPIIATPNDRRNTIVNSINHF